jgi:hypothetical protein
VTNIGISKTAEILGTMQERTYGRVCCDMTSNPGRAVASASRLRCGPPRLMPVGTEDEVGEEGLTADVDKEADSPGAGARLGFDDLQHLDAVHRRGERSVADVDLEVGPFVVPDVGRRFIAAVRILSSQPVEWPVGIGEVLDRPSRRRGSR